MVVRANFEDAASVAGILVPTEAAGSDGGGMATWTPLGGIARPSGAGPERALRGAGVPSLRGTNQRQVWLPSEHVFGGRTGDR